MVKKYLIYETNIVVLQYNDDNANRLLSIVNLFNIGIPYDIKIMSMSAHTRFHAYIYILPGNKIDLIGWTHEWNKHTPNLESIYEITHTIWKIYE